MNKDILLKELMVQNTAEEALNNEMQKEIDATNKIIEELKEQWSVFVKDAFPEEVAYIMARFGKNGVELTNYKESKYADTIYPIISTNDLHIAFTDEGIVFIQGTKTIGFHFYQKDDLLYDKYGTYKWDSYPVTCWNYLPEKLGYDTRKSSMARNRAEINLVHEYEKMLADFQDNLPEIYEEIARRNAERIAAKRDIVSPKVEKQKQEPKKYKVTVEIEEI